MKKYLFIVIMLVIAIGCNYVEPERNDIPYEISKAILDADSSTTSSVYLVEDTTKLKHYYFNENKELLYCYDANPNRTNVHGMIIFLIIFISGIFGFICGLTAD